MNFEWLSTIIDDVIVMDYESILADSTGSTTPDIDSEAIEGALDAIIEMVGVRTESNVPITPNSCITSIL